MTTLLDKDLVDDALHGLHDWSGGTDSISRVVTLSGSDAETLLADVAATADSMNHDP